ncbi:NADH-quinone oxidoreductase subunit NuoE [Thermodesulfobacteriota bacterium]
MAQTTAVTRYHEEDPLKLEGQLSKIFREFAGRPDDLIPVLQHIQAALGYLPEEALLEVAYLTGLPSAKVFGVATFYTLFRLQPVGKHIIRVCRGTACHVRGSSRILKGIQSQLQVAPGETTEDRLFTLETVSCFGSCALAPVVVIDDRVYGRMNPSKVHRLLEEIRAEAEGSKMIDHMIKKSVEEQNGLYIHEG